MTYFIFQCKNCNVEPAYLVDATKTVLCGNCRTFGIATELTDAEVAELDLPETSEPTE
jgi:hypothetical protein